MYIFGTFFVIFISRQKQYADKFYTMKRIKGSLLLIVLCISLPVSAQVMSTELQNFYDDFASKKLMAGPKIEIYDGSPYLNDEFTSGKIILDNGNEYNDILLRYNIYYDQFEFNRDGEELALEKGKYYSCFILGEEYFFYREFFIGNKKIEGYLKRITDGEYSLYIRYSALLREAEKPEPYKEARKAMFIPVKPIYLIGKNDGSIYEIKNSRDFLKNFSYLEEDIRNNFDKKLKLKKEEDFVNLLNYLNGKNE